jgi:GT2 family glycosyltransferase
MTLTIVIVNWNTRDFLVDALRSIYEEPAAHGFETIVIDNASGDGSAGIVEAEFPQVRLIANKENAGYARGNNQGIEASAGKFVLLLNPDVVMPGGGLEKVVEWMERHKDVAALGVKLVNPDGSLQRSVRGFPYHLSILFDAVGLGKLFPRSRIFSAYRAGWLDYYREAEVDQPMGTFLLIPRSAIEDVGVFDVQFPIFFNEVDWCYRAKRKGWKIVYSPVIDVVHYGGGSTKQVSAQMAWESRNSLLRFYRKHYPSLLFAPIYWLATAASWIQAWLAAGRRKK